MNKCFGVPSMFSADSKFCKACPEFKRCCAKCHDELMQIKELGDLAKAIAKHEAAMVEMGLLESKTYKIPRKTKKTVVKLDIAEEALLAELEAKGVLDQYKMLTGDLSLAPAPFALVEYTVPIWLLEPLPRSSRPAPTGRPFSENALWVLP